MPEPLPGLPPSTELMELSLKLDAIAEWQNDTGHAGPTSRTLTRAAIWLKAASRKTCGQGCVGCRGGDACSSDHK